MDARVGVLHPLMAQPGSSPARCGDYDIEEDIDAFIDRYSGMSRRLPRPGFCGRILGGRFRFSAEIADIGGDVKVQGAYSLLIKVPATFPREAPQVFETGGRIKREADYHVLANGALCLGTLMELNQRAKRCRSLLAFTEECLVPYLSAARLGEEGREVPPLLKELAHGRSGLVADYLDIFGLTSTNQLVYAMRLLLWPQDMAYAQPCPCECGQRLDFCHYRQKFDELQRQHSWSQFRQYLGQITDETASNGNTPPKLSWGRGKEPRETLDSKTLRELQGSRPIRA